MNETVPFLGKIWVLCNHERVSFLGKILVWKLHSSTKRAVSAGRGCAPPALPGSAHGQCHALTKRSVHFHGVRIKRSMNAFLGLCRAGSEKLRFFPQKVYLGFFARPAFICFVFVWSFGRFSQGKYVFQRRDSYFYLFNCSCMFR
jgi:hypothetical protein